MDPGADRLVRRLIERRLIEDLGTIVVERLSGGVSAEVFLVSDGNRRLVVKRALERLRVAQDWLSSPLRIFREAEALAFAAGIRPGNVPRILDVDREALLLCMTAAPTSMRNWKTDLLAGPSARPVLAEGLGAALADWHAASAEDPSVRGRFADATNFFELRISPFFHRCAEVHADLAQPIETVVRRMGERARSLVHGDFSPKNVLYEAGGFLVLDWETAHWGDPTFDLAFLTSHLVCKALHRPSGTPGYRADAEAFVASYLANRGLGLEPTELVAQVGCLVLARVDGKSPVDYLGPDQQDRARAFARWVLTERPAAAEMWSML